MRRIPYSFIVLGIGLIGSVVLPAVLVPSVDFEPPPLVGDPEGKVDSRFLQYAPASSEIPRFEKAVDIGAELSGACLLDRDGFIWIGTFGAGLYRYDGKDLKRFAPSLGYLSGSNITALHEDDEGVIWIGSLSGLDRYDKRTGEFSTVPVPLDQSGLDKGWGVWCLENGKSGNLLIGTNGYGLIDFSPETGAAKRYRHDGGDPDSIPDNNVYRIEPATDGKHWLATFGGGAARFDVDSGRVDLRLTEESGLSNSHVWSVYEDDQGNLWAGTQQGLNRYELATGEMTQFAFEPGNRRTIGGRVVTSIHEDKEGDIWITCFNGETGLSKIERETGRVRRYGPEQGWSRRGARTVFDDRSGIFWVAAMGELVKYDRRSIGFSLTRLGSGLLPIFEDRGGTIWLGTMDGLRRMNRETGEAEPVAEAELSDQIVTAFAEDGHGNFWLGIYGGDLLLFDPRGSRVLERFTHEPGNPESLPQSNCIRRILEDNQEPGRLWLSTQGGGLAAFDMETRKVTQYRHIPGDPESLSSDTASYGALWQDRDGTLWVGTDSGLNRLEKGADRFDRYLPEPGQNGLYSGVIQAILRDSHRGRYGQLWVGTSDGLHYVRDEKDGSFGRLTVEDGLSDNMILGILEDEGRLWLSTPSGLTKYDPSGATPTEVYGAEEGLQADTFLLTSFFKTKDGEFWFGGSKGVSHFRPPRLSESGDAPRVILTSLQQNGEEMDLKAAPSKTREIRLEWPANFFEFEMSSLDYSMPNLRRYRYRLEGVDKTWYESSRGYGRYSGLPGGEYLLRIQAANRAGDWPEDHEGTSLLVAVEPPFWEARWFVGLCLVAISVLSASAIHYLCLLRKEVRERRRAEAERDHAEGSRLLESEKALTLQQKSIEAARDFRESLSVVIVEMELLKEDLDEKLRKDLESGLKSAEEAAKRCSRLTSELISLGEESPVDVK